MENKTRFIKTKKIFVVRGNKNAPEQTKLFIKGVEVPLTTNQRYSLFECKHLKECKRFVRSQIFKNPTEYKKSCVITKYHTHEKLVSENGKVLASGTFKEYQDVLNVTNNFVSKNTGFKMWIGDDENGKPIYKEEDNKPYCEIKITGVWL